MEMNYSTTCKKKLSYSHHSAHKGALCHNASVVSKSKAIAFLNLIEADREVTFKLSVSLPPTVQGNAAEVNSKL